MLCVGFCRIYGVSADTGTSFLEQLLQYSFSKGILHQGRNVLQNIPITEKFSNKETTEKNEKPRLLRIIQSRKKDKYYTTCKYSFIFAI